MAVQNRNFKLNPHVSVDCVIFGFDNVDLKVLLIERETGDANETVDDLMALPGNLILENEDLDEAAQRVLKELTGLSDLYLEQFWTFGNPNRLNKPEDQRWLEAIREIPEARVITVAYYSLVKLEDYSLTPSGFARKASWVKIKDIQNLAFDHNEILNKALEVLKSDLHKIPAGFELMPQKFTLSQLQLLYESILQTELDKRNFRRKILKTGIIKPLKEKQEGVSHKPARYYMFNKKYQGLQDFIDKS
ncbi:MAG: NUDIX hydrolase [Flavobacteriales bacterium]|nr:NUDIX hydrolase [Flavobacteriales bacterium]